MKGYKLSPTITETNGFDATEQGLVIIIWDKLLTTYNTLFAVTERRLLSAESVNVQN